MESSNWEERKSCPPCAPQFAKGIVLAVTLLLGGAVAGNAGIWFRDDFERGSVGDEWRTASGAFAIVDGAMKGGMRDSDTHPAIAKVSRNFGDIVLQFRFRFDGARSFNIVFNDIAEKSVHSGHVARVTFSPQGLVLTDDKTGLMNLKWFAKRSDPGAKEDIERVRGQTSRRFPVSWESGRWYAAKVVVEGESVSVSLDGREAGTFRSPGFGHPTKTSFHFSISGRDLTVDDVDARTVKKR